MLKVLTAGLLITALFNFLVFSSQPGIGFSFFVVFINIAVLVLKDKESRNPLLSYFFGGASAAFALLINFRSNGVVQLVDLVSALFFLSLNLYFSKSNLNFDFSFTRFFTAPFKSGLNFVEGIILSLTPKTWAEHSAQKHITSSLLRGIFIGIPVLLVLFLILSRADPIFENITFSFLEDVWVRIIFSVIIFISALAVGVMKITEHESQKEIKEVTPGKEYELLVILGGLALLFGGFIFIQFKYLFSNIGERELLSLGIKSLTYSEYVRKGFFELLLAAVVSSGIVLYILQFIHKLKGSGKLLVQLFSSVVTLEVGMMLFSAAQRVNLYQMEHGLTRARVFGMFFLVWLGILLAVLLIKIVKDLNNRIYLSLNIISTLIILILLNTINIDGLIATKYKPTVNNEIDFYYLAFLSSEAHESWIPAINQAEGVVLNLKDKQDLNAEDYRVIYWNFSAIEAIKGHVDYLNDKYGPVDQAIQRHKEIRQTMDQGSASRLYGEMPLAEDVYMARKWQSANMGESTAFEFIRLNQGQFVKLPNLTQELRVIRDRVNPNIINTTILDRSTNPPLSN